MKPLFAWARAHPLKALVILAFAILSGIVAATDSVAIGLLLLVLTLGGFALVFTLDTTRMLSLLVAVSLSSLTTQAGTNETYTVNVGDVNGNLLKLTNVVSVKWNHEPGCTLVTHIVHGSTNKFHAWLVPVFVTTNKLNKAKR